MVASRSHLVRRQISHLCCPNARRRQGKQHHRECRYRRASVSRYPLACLLGGSKDQLKAWQEMRPRVRRGREKACRPVSWSAGTYRTVSADPDPRGWRLIARMARAFGRRRSCTGARGSSAVPVAFPSPGQWVTARRTCEVVVRSGAEAGFEQPGSARAVHGGRLLGYNHRRLRHCGAGWQQLGSPVTGWSDHRLRLDVDSALSSASPQEMTASSSVSSVV